jgi:hypothetical protein
METPCPRCGTTKTESVRHGYIYSILWKMGYHLRRCSFCNRRRLIRRGDRNRPHPNDLTAEELTESFNRRIAAAKRRDAAVVKSRGEIKAPDSSEQLRGNEASPRTISIGVADANDEVEDYRLCPNCGSTRYRRSRRRWWERLIKRPRMARCSKCDHRFPYPH